MNRPTITISPAGVASLVLPIGTIIGIGASLLTLNYAWGTSFPGYLIWLIAGILSTFGVTSLISLPWQGAAKLIGTAGVFAVAISGCNLGILHPIFLIQGNNTEAPELFFSAGLLFLGLVMIVVTILASRLSQSTTLPWIALAALGLNLTLAMVSILRLVDSYVIIANALPPIVSALPYAALLLVGISVWKHNCPAPIVTQPEPTTEQQS